MRPMLKTDFFALVRSLFAAGITPTLLTSTLTASGYLRWKSAEGKEESATLFFAHNCRPSTARVSRKRFIGWFDELQQERLTQLANAINVGDRVVHGGVERTVTEIRATVIREANGTPKASFRNGVIILNRNIEALVTDVTPVKNAQEAAQAHEKHAETVTDYKPLSMRLVRHANCQYDHNMPPSYRNRGRKVFMYIAIGNYEDNEERTERQLDAMETLLNNMGWKENNDTCPNYAEGQSCGFWIHPDELDKFRIDYMTAKKALPNVLARQADSESQPRVPDDILPVMDDGTLTVKGATYIAVNMKYPLELFVIQSHVFVGAIRTDHKYDKNFYLGVDQKHQRQGREVFLKLQGIRPDFITSQPEKFHQQEERIVVLMPDKDYYPAGGWNRFKMEIAGEDNQK